MAQFINARENIVIEAIDGLIAASSGKLARLDGFPHIKVVIRADWNKQKVALISGGGAGHEPSHAGFVGQGLLTAAICGDVFASPSVDAVLAGILAVTGDAGCLLIVKNYTGDRLNFGLAAEKARALGKNVDMVIVDDDIALPDLPQPRGLAGTLFVHKIAGALADQGADLATIGKAAREVIAGVSSIGMSLDTCTVPGSEKEARIPHGKAELGLGIHGEPGVEQVDFASAKDAIARIAEKLSPKLASGKYIALLNNLGGTSALEMSVLAHELLQSRLGAHIGHLIGPSSMMTSLDMRGFSVSLLPETFENIAALQHSVSSSHWPVMQEIGAVKIAPMPEGLKPAKPKASANDAARAILSLACQSLIAAQAYLNALDAKSGDGDTGSTLAVAANAILGSLDDMPLADLALMMRSLGQVLSESMGGSSGVLLAIFFSAAGDAAATGANLHDALMAGLQRLQEIGGAELGDRTMVDALAPALAAMPKGLQQAADAARKGADHTASIVKARSGRASYVNAAQLAGHNDPGAEAVARLFAALAKG